ncbi:PBSX family phage terminase large subunit [Cohnella thailandensis]|uniref:PBSX family phage terminase large subunit n=1 Tax=Cohnella thailandensis TaxID=557557 RepID=A0A841SLH9_9BACL|nr:PBSX family phage terminase large subunit [Cohnella thailandensis]MBB6632774.1 PBSX family phage terminase large subunit [Cohnella thailandensis]MBP1975536.1 PBSX family phage terminase large subunit [Cohnella thailandensis]
MQVKLTELIAPSFYEVHHAVKNGAATHFLLSGGRGSTKSSFTPTEIVLGMIADPDANAIALRKVKDTLRESVYESYVWAIDKLGVPHLFDARVSPMQIVYKPTGQRIIFRGADNPIKIKSLRLRKGFFKYVWYEEADEFGVEDIRSINQTLLRGGHDYRVFYSYNPPKSRKRWVHEYRKNPPKDWLAHHSDYRSVPRHWLGEQFFLEAESLRERNELAYRHEYLGEDTGTGGEVFRNLTLRRISDEEIASFDRIKRGLDFGFASHPSHYGVMHFDATRRRLFIFHELHKAGMSNRKLADGINAENKSNRQVTADSAEPRTIAELRNLGVNIKGAKKGPDSVDHGMKFLEDLDEIIIDPVRCPNTAREFDGYELDPDGNGGWKEGYPDRDNHSIDAVRYALEDEMKRPGISFN